MASKWMLFGLAFLLSGLLFLLMVLTSRLGRADVGILGLLGGALTIVGAVSVCVRTGVILDRRRGTITTWWGLLVPLHKTDYPLSQTQYVILSREEREAGDRTYEVFPVKLEGAGAHAITLQEPRDYDKARRLAEEVATFIQLGIRDRSSGEEVAREAGALDQSLRERAKRTGGSMPLPAQPPRARAILNHGGARAPTTIEIPPARRSVRWFVLTLFIAGFVAVFTELAMDGTDMEIGGRALFTFSLVYGFFLPLLLRTAILRECLVVSPDELVVTRRDIFGTRTTRLPGGEVEEVVVTPARHGIYGAYASFGGGTNRVVIRSDRGSVELGSTLSKQDELQWLRDVLVHVLTSAPLDADA